MTRELQPDLSSAELVAPAEVASPAAGVRRGESIRRVKASRLIGSVTHCRGLTFGSCSRESRFLAMGGKIISCPAVCLVWRITNEIYRGAWKPGDHPWLAFKRYRAGGGLFCQLNADAIDFGAGLGISELVLGPALTPDS